MVTVTDGRMSVMHSLTKAHNGQILMVTISETTLEESTPTRALQLLELRVLIDTDVRIQIPIHGPTQTEDGQYSRVLTHAHLRGVIPHWTEMAVWMKMVMDSPT